MEAVAGGVAANSALRRAFEQATQERGLKLFFPRMDFCTDNAAMVALAGYQKFERGITSNFELAARPNLELT